MDFPLLQDLVILLCFSVGIVFLLQRLQLPPILGFLITGVLIGPSGLSLIEAVEEVEIISEIGVILLLFMIGMEMSLRQLAYMRKIVFIGGFLQVTLTMLVAGVTFYLLGNSLSESVFIGFLFSLSSTAIVLKILQDRDEINTPQGRNALGILIFQDIIVVPMMLLVPIISGASENVGMSLLLLVIKSIVVIGLTVILAKFIVPKIMYAIAKTKSRELFILTTIAICFAVTYFTSEAGLSLALGAFLAGLIVSESEYSHQATGVIFPFRELFVSFFFISIGMLLDLGFFFDHIGIILVLVVLVFIVKSIIVASAVAVLKYPRRIIILTGILLFQVGEFAFILSIVGIEYELIDTDTYQYFLAVSIVTMFLTPIVIHFSEWLTDIALKTTGTISSEEKTAIAQNDKELKNHLVIIGYGVNGSNLALAARHSNIPYVIIELDAATVRMVKQKDIPIIYGDATNENILHAANISKARAVVIAISDSSATKNIITHIRNISQSLYLLVRTRYIRETEELLALGADDVIPEEFETSVEIFSRIMHNFLVPTQDIDHLVNSVRADNYDIFKTKKLPRTSQRTEIPDFNITSVRITSDSSKVTGKSIEELDLRKNYGINVLAVARKSEFIQPIMPEIKLKRDDLVYIHGSSEDIEKFHRLVS